MSKATDNKRKKHTAEDELREIFERRCLLKKDEWDLSIDIIKDLGCWGIDAYELLEEICIKYEMNCKEFFPEDVIGIEGIDFRANIFNPFYLYKLLFDKEKISPPKFTIGMLLKAIENKKLKSDKPPHGYFYAKEVIVE